MNQRFMIPPEMVPFQMSLSARRLHISMVPLSEKRHRLYPHDVPEVVEGLKLRLEALLEARIDPERAESVFRLMYRLLTHGKGRPKYPEFSWEFLQYFLDVGISSLS